MKTNSYICGMKSQEFNALKGIHPGLFLEYELKKRNLPKGQLALSIGEYPQTISAITKGKRLMNTALALKIEHKLNIEEGFFMILQTYYEIKQIKQQENKSHHPDLQKLRKILFWDTSFENIDWILQKEAIIKRVFERGNEQEKNELIAFYGDDIVNKILKKKEN